MFICSKLRQNLSHVEVMTFVRIQRVIWDHLLAFKGEIIHQCKIFTEIGEISARFRHDVCEILNLRKIAGDIFHLAEISPRL